MKSSPHGRFRRAVDRGNLLDAEECARELGHTGSFWAEQPEAGSHLINTFFDSGRVDDSRYTPIAVDFTPDATLTGNAKAIAGIMFGLVLVTVGSLAWMWRRVQTRSSFGRASSAALRSVYSVVLGVGGWTLGLLIAMTFWPSLPLDNVLLVIVSVGVPIGLGIYWAWVQSSWTDGTKTAGLATAMASALVGAWLGFNVMDGLLAPITAIVGPIAATNLGLIACDVWRERSTRKPRAVATPPLAQPSTSD